MVTAKVKNKKCVKICQTKYLIYIRCITNRFLYSTLILFTLFIKNAPMKEHTKPNNYVQ